MSGEPRFPHRLNRDGTFDSICRVCFATVASVVDEAELAHHEAAHVCSRPDLDKYHSLPRPDHHPEVAGVITQ